MIATDLAIQQGTTRLALPTERATDVTVDTGPHGLESIKVSVPLNLYQAFDLYRRLSANVRAVVSAGGVIASGRCEDIAINNEGADIEALGDWRALSDVPLTAFYSKADLDGFRVLTRFEAAGLGINDARFEHREGDDGYLAIMTKKGATYTAGNRAGGLIYEVPDQARNGAANLTFDVTFVAPAAGWIVECRLYNSLGSVSTFWTFTSAGAGTYTTSVATAPGVTRAQVVFVLVVPAAYTEAGETGDNYLRISNLRIVAALGTFRATTLGTAVAAPGTQACTPASMAGIYVGQRLYIDQQTTSGESVVVASVTSTTFTATYTKAHLSTATVRAATIYADDIAEDMRDYLLTVNAGALSSSNDLIQSPGLDLLDQVYEDEAMGEALDALAADGDGTQLWEVGVDTLSRLYLRPQGDAAQTWYVDASEIEAQQTLSQLVNSAYAVYKSASGRALRTAPAGDTDSVTRYGLTRRKAVKASTTNASIAAQVAQNEVIAAADPIPQSGVAFRRVYTAQGADVPLYLVKAGDTFVIRNLPPSADTSIDKLRSFRLARTSYDVLANVLKVVPESPLPELEYQLAQALPPL